MIISVREINHPETNELDHYLVEFSDGVISNVPIKIGNRHYDEIMRQVADGELTITEAE